MQTNRIVSIFIFLSVCSFNGMNVTAISCFECDDLYKPYLCDIVTQCAQDQQCFVDEYITSSGNILYKSGCRSTQRCSITKREVRVSVNAHDVSDDVASDVASDILFCSECCNNTEYCNKEGCKQTVPGRKQRGPFCFDCKRQGKNGCRQVTQCDQYEVCEISTEERNGLTLYNSRCVNPQSPQSCNISTNDPTNMYIGKRDRIPTSYCPQCCSEDFCNSDCDILTVVDGAWSEWGSWGSCSATCDLGLARRTRTCSNPPPSTNGQYCNGSSSQSKLCNSGVDCHIQSGWTDWGIWSRCSVTCGIIGIQIRKRVCLNPTSTASSQSCPGRPVDSRACNSTMVTCPPGPIDGGWTSWHTWTPCLGHCVQGYRQRIRTCTNPIPKPGGHTCHGNHIQREICKSNEHCKSSGYSSWHTWSSCSASCGYTGIIKRTRTCRTGIAGHGNCEGSNQEILPCNEFPCH